MKAILEFNLPDDAPYHHHAIMSMSYFSAIWDFKIEIRNLLKHGSNEKDLDCNTLDVISRRFSSILNNHKIDLYATVDQ